MKRLLVPTDFSPTAERAFRIALDLAQRAKASIVLYHTYAPMESSFVGVEETRKQYNAQAEVNIAKKLQRLKKKVAGDAGGVVVSTVVGHTPIIDNILGFAEHNHIDLIVMGTQGGSGLKKTIIGSVAARIIENSDLPVLLVPEKFELMIPKHFVYATNFSSADKRALQTVGEIAKLYEAQITVLHLGTVYTTEVEKEKDKKDFDTYALHLQKELNEFKIKFHMLEVSSVSKTMEELDKKIPYDVMSMLRRKKTFFEKFFLKSFTQNMAYVTSKLLLIIPEEE